MPVTNTLSQNAGNISQKGDDLGAIRIVNSDGTHSGSETYMDLPLRGKMDFTFDQPEEEIYGESGRVLTTEEGNVKCEIKLTLLENGSNVFNFLNTDVQNRYFSIVLAGGQGSNNTNKWFYAPVTKIQRGWGTHSQPGGTLEMTVKVLDNPTAFNGASLTAGTVTSWYNFPATVSSLTASISGAAHTYFVVRNV
jgi:hypothetical protein